MRTNWRRRVRRGASRGCRVWGGWGRRSREPDPGDGFEAMGVLCAGGVLSSGIAGGGAADVEDAGGGERAGHDRAAGVAAGGAGGWLGGGGSAVRDLAGA